MLLVPVLLHRSHVIERLGGFRLIGTGGVHRRETTRTSVRRGLLHTGTYFRGYGDDILLHDETSRVENELSDGETPETLLHSKEIGATVNVAIDALSEDLRQAIVLREIEGLSYEEIAAVMNCPIGTVRSRIFRAREAIAERLRPLLGTREGERW